MSSKNFDQLYFKKYQKRNQFISLNLIDSENNIFDTSTEDIKYAVDIEEFQTRVEEITFGCELLTSQEYIIANGMKPFTHKTTVVLCDNPVSFGSSLEYKYRRNMKFLPRRDFLDFVIKHERRRKTPLFFVLNNELEQINLCINTLEMAISDRKVMEDGKTSIKLDLDMFSHLKRKTVIKTELSEKFDEEQRLKDKNSGSNMSKTILNGSMTIIKKIEPKKILGYKYHFVRQE